MIHLLRNLMPIQLFHRQNILQELDEVSIIYFIEKGEIDFGYEINKQSRWVIRIPKAIVGMYEVIYEKRCYFQVRAHQHCKGYFIKKQEFVKIKDIFAQGWADTKEKTLQFYINFLRKPIQKKKNKDFKMYSERHDYQQVLAVQDYNPSELEILEQYQH